ncbi:MAG: zinc metalloprotease HtpX [Actinobacteria bacterium]|nr:zinc metalloprotease HtpX [Actinomycetota bacterium]
MSNNLKTVGLLSLMTVLVFWLGYYFGGEGGLWIGVILAFGLNFAAYFFSDKMALAASRAKPVSEAELPEVYSIVRNLTTATGLPMPRLFIIESQQPNAFATGRNPSHAAVAVTTGILQLMNREELEGVLAHELSHVQNRDILISSVAAMLAAALSIFGRMALFMGGGRDDRNNPLAGIATLLSLVLAPIAAMIIRMAISRSREFQADRSGAEITGQPLQLASALAKLEAGTSRVAMNVNPAVSQLFIADPLHAFKGRRGGGLMSLFSTHPAVPDRIARLQAMANQF